MIASAPVAPPTPIEPLPRAVIVVRSLESPNGCWMSTSTAEIPIVPPAATPPDTSSTSVPDVCVRLTFPLVDVIAASSVTDALEMVSAFAGSLKAPAPMSGEALNLYRLLVHLGHAEADTTAIVKVFDR